MNNSEKLKLLQKKLRNHDYKIKELREDMNDSYKGASSILHKCEELEESVDMWNTKFDVLNKKLFELSVELNSLTEKFESK